MTKSTVSVPVRFQTKCKLSGRHIYRVSSMQRFNISKTAAVDTVGLLARSFLGQLNVYAHEKLAVDRTGP